jgi:predicted DNA-binding protein (MmcQ/YjbR family)
MPKTNPCLLKMREICLSLPDTKETPTWGKPHFRVGEKIFAGFGDAGGGPLAGFKLEKGHARSILEDSRFARAPYVGQHGWVTMDLLGVTDWEEVRALILESYRLIAPKKSLAKLGAAVKSAQPRLPAGKSKRR